MEADEAPEVSRMARDVFNEFVAPLYSGQGRKEFMRFSTPRNILSRRHQVLVAEDAASHELVGMLVIRDLSHIAMLFVKKSLQRQGVGKQLIEQAEHFCRTRAIPELTVHAAPNSVDAYLAYGFRVIGDEHEVRGIVFTPMSKDL